MGMTQNAYITDAQFIVRITDVASFFSALSENTTYTVATDTRTSARRFAENVTSRDGAEAEVWSVDRLLAILTDHVGWCVPVVA